MLKPLFVVGCALSLSACLTQNSQDELDKTGSPERSAEIQYQPYSLDPEGRVETVTIQSSETSSGERRFTLESSQFQRDDMPRERTFVESADALRVETGSVLFDGLFAMAVDDLKLLSVDAIRDDQYNQGNEIDCQCFQTGEKWHYVWTRDLAYAADLSLAVVDPQRTINSLRFKTSDFRPEASAPDHLPEGSRQIIQDTGSGGSWAVSTDRVSWALAAERVMHQLSGEERESFERDTFASLRGTIEADRRVAFDPQDGLYGGEQSYLDWRVQTYAPWITNNLSRMAESKALSTNVMHYRAILLAASLSERRGEPALADRYHQWAADLKRRINERFWLETEGLYASLTGPNEVPVVTRKYDMLGTALAILYGIADEKQAKAAMNHYPHAPFGVPVYYPQQPDQRVYHNRGIWPFVTAYALKAGASVNNYKVVDNAVNSLMRGAALNLSNMENLEWLTAKPWYDDGPVINSRRQLWSVAGYLAMVMETVFGYRVNSDGIEIAPFLTVDTRRRLGDQSSVWLRSVDYRGKGIAIELVLPDSAGGDGYFPVDSVRLNGDTIDGRITDEMLAENNHIQVRFAARVTNDSRLTTVPAVDPLSRTEPAVFSPAAPTITSLESDGQSLVVRFSDDANIGTDASVRYNLYRNDTQVASDLDELQWTDRSDRLLDRRQCYAVEAVYRRSGHRSHLSEPVCHNGAGAQDIAINDERITSNLPITPPSAMLEAPTLKEWGQEGDSLSLDGWVVERDGRYVVRLRYNNRQHTIDSGVTNAIKQLVIRDANGVEVARRIVQMPNVEDRDDRHPLRRSTEVEVSLNRGEYQLQLEDYFNMSYLSSNRTYGASGGQGGPVNRASIAAFELIYLGEAPE